MKKEMLEKVYNTQKNIIVAGDIAAGKTTSVLFPLVDKMIEQKESLMILDSKEEYINKYYNELKNKDYNIVILNLRDFDKSEGWNPLQLAYELYKNGSIDKAIDYLEKIGKTIFYDASENDPFWTLTASDLFTGIVLALFEDAKEYEVNFNSVNMILEGVNERYYDSKQTIDYLTCYFLDKNPSSLSYVYASTAVFAPRDTRASIMSVAKQKLMTYVSREKLSMLMNKTTFNFEEIKTKPTAIFFIAKDESKHLNTLASIFIEQLFTFLLDSKVANKFNFVLDNFDSIEKVNEFTDMLGAGLSRGIRFVVSTRFLEDLSTKYGSYITKLSNQVYTTNDLLKIKMNDKEETIENEYEELENVSNEIDYPNLNQNSNIFHFNQNSIKVFDLKRYVISNCHLRNIGSDVPTLSIHNSTVDVDDLIKRIDEKIVKIDEGEKQATASDKLENKDELQKIDNTQDSSNFNLKEVICQAEKDNKIFSIPSPEINKNLNRNVTSEDWTAIEMPQEHVEFEMERLLTVEGINLLKKGHIPEEEADKWFWYVENNVLSIHRSWTGFCWFKIELNTNGKLKVIANRNPEQYTETNIEKEKKWINNFLDYWTKEHNFH